MWPTLLTIVACALAWTLFDVLRKALVTRIDALVLVGLLSAGQVPFLGAWAAAAGAWPPPAAYWLPGGASVLLNVAANIAFIYALKLSPLSLTIPLLSLTPVLTTLLAVPLLGEVPSPVQFVGIVLTVAGAFRLNLARGERSDPVTVWRALRREPGSLLMALVALLWSLSMPLDKVAMAHSGTALHAVLLALGVATGAFVALAAQGRMARVSQAGRAPGWLVAGVAVSAAALVLQLVAVQMTWVGLVETFKRGLGSVLALALGALLFREAVDRNKVLATFLMVAGVVLTLLG